MVILDFSLLSHGATHQVFPVVPTDRISETYSSGSSTGKISALLLSDYDLRLEIKQRLEVAPDLSCARMPYAGCAPPNVGVTLVSAARLQSYLTNTTDLHDCYSTNSRAYNCQVCVRKTLT